MLKCKDITNHASDYLDKQLPLLKRLEIKLHILICHHCRRFMEQFQLSIHTLKNIPGTPPAESEIDATVEKMKQAMKNNN